MFKRNKSLGIYIFIFGLYCIVSVPELFRGINEIDRIALEDDLKSRFYSSVKFGDDDCPDDELNPPPDGGKLPEDDCPDDDLNPPPTGPTPRPTPYPKRYPTSTPTPRPTPPRRKSDDPWCADDQYC